MNGVRNFGSGRFAAAQPRPDLAQAEQLEVVDQEGARAAPGTSPARTPPAGRACGRGIGDRPDRCQDRPPQPEQQDQGQARQQHVGRAFDGMRHEARPPALEGRPRHDAVLDGEQAEQQGVDHQCRDQRAFGAAVDGLGHRQIADEGDGVEEGHEEQRIDDDAVQNRSDTTHGGLPGSRYNSVDRPNMRRCNSVDRPSQG